MLARQAVVAGQFYGGSEKQCLAEVEECLGAIEVPAGLKDEIVGGVVPHAGWVFSGDLAGLVFSAIKKVHPKVDTFLIFGASHRYSGREGVVYDKGSWETPLGIIDIDEELAGQIAELNGVKADKNAHRDEHSIEVQVPFIQYLFPEAKIVPVIVPSFGFDIKPGNEIASIVSKLKGKKVVCIASTDLTHYGPRYGFCPEGVGADAIRWAKEVNDVEFINLALNLEAEKLFAAALKKSSACGPGAVAMLVSVVKGLGKKEGVLLGHTHSNEVLEKKYGQSSQESVGYAAIVY